MNDTEKTALFGDSTVINLVAKLNYLYSENRITNGADQTKYMYAVLYCTVNKLLIITVIFNASTVTII